MQATRRTILEMLKKWGQATVGELAGQLDLTPMTVRHHLNVLKAQELVITARLRHGLSVGRPCQVYTLTDRGNDLFPANYHGLADYILKEIKKMLDSAQVRQIFHRIGEKLAAEAPDVSSLPLPERIVRVAEILTDKGFISQWEKVEGGYALHQFNCPYHRVAREHGEVCEMDKALVSQLLGVQSRRIRKTASTGGHCTYLVPSDLT